ncbi:interferon-induced protein 44-like [Ciona intestinalis]
MGSGVRKHSSSFNPKMSLLGGGSLLKSQWRNLAWDEKSRFELIETIREYKPLAQVGVQQARLLLLGHVNVGKSSFFNTINSIFRNHVTAQAPVGSPRDQRSITTKMRAYQVRNGREGKDLNFKIVDTMGIEEERRKGFDPTELPYLLDGHVSDNHQFDPSGNISPEMPGFQKLPKLPEKIHCCIFVIDATSVSSLSDELLNKLNDMRTKITGRGIPIIVLMTKIDKACDQTRGDVSLVYKSATIQHLIAQTSSKIGVPVSHVLPVKNYTHEIELDPWVDVLALSALQQMLRFTDNYFDECLVTSGTGYVPPEKQSSDAWTRKATLNGSSAPAQMKQAWSNNNASTPTAVAGRITGVSVHNTPSGRNGVMAGVLGTPASKFPEAEKKPLLLEENHVVELDEEKEEKERIDEDLVKKPEVEEINQNKMADFNENLPNQIPQEVA